MKMLMKIIYSSLMKIVLLPCHLLPIKSNRIAFIGLTGGNSYEYSDNLKYICEALLVEASNSYEIMWLVAKPEKYLTESKRGINFYRHHRLTSFFKLLTAKVVISSGAYVPWFPFRQKQYVINTWHGGGAYKKVENDKPNANFLTRKRAKFLSNNINLFLSSCQKATKHLIRGAFGYCGEVLESGLPRNDFLQTNQTVIARKKVLEYFGFADEDKILLYVPTYREIADNIVFDSSALQQRLNKSENNWKIITRTHRYENDCQSICISGDMTYNASDYPDVQELLCATDLLITDYSSIIWDYSLLMRPCCLYTPDLTYYLKNTGFYTPIQEWPFPIVRTWEELMDFITNYDLIDIQKKIRKHHLEMGSFERGHACNDVIQRITKDGICF